MTIWILVNEEHRNYSWPLSGVFLSKGEAMEAVNRLNYAVSMWEYKVKDPELTNE